ncbi:MAG: uracil-DNA glycosylase [Candidatus Nanohaloarchaea archaeon]
MSFRQKYSEFFRQLDSGYFDGERFVPAVGPDDADAMLVGEAPGANEVEEREPFVGRAGEKLDEILHRIGVDRDELYITNLVKIRPPGNRDPKKDEIEAWEPLLREEIEEIDPEFIIPLGNFASKELLDTSKCITSIHGRIFSREGQKIMPTFHPAAVLYDNTKEPELEEDLRKAFGREKSGQTRLDEM